MHILENIKQQKIYESLDESFIIEKIKKIFQLFIKTLLINNNILCNIMMNLKWSFYNKKNIIILYFQSYQDLNIFVTIKNQLLNFICHQFNNPYMYIIYSNNFILSEINDNIIYLKKKLCLKKLETFN